VVGYQLGRQLDENTAVGCLLHGAIFVVFLWFLGGLGLESTPTSVWTGLLLTIFTAVLSLLPIGVLLALGRQSSLQLCWLSILYIEVIRGPLIGILFLLR